MVAMVDRVLMSGHFSQTALVRRGATHCTGYYEYLQIKENTYPKLDTFEA